MLALATVAAFGGVAQPASIEPGGTDEFNIYDNVNRITGRPTHADQPIGQVHVAELQRLIDPESAGHRPIVLDLEDVKLVDDETGKDD